MKRKRKNAVIKVEEVDPIRLSGNTVNVITFKGFVEKNYKLILVLVIFTIIVNIPNYLEPPFGVSPAYYLYISLYSDLLAGYIGYKAFTKKEIQNN